MQSVAVFCGANKGKDPIYVEIARQAGRSLVQRGCKIVFGAGSVGLMGEVADAALAAGGHPIGVITEFLVGKEVCHKGLPELYVVPTMHERKVKMAELSDAVLTLPGGFGTLDELFELVTLGQLGHDRRPIGILNTRGFYDAMLRQIDVMIEEGFIKENNRDLLIVDSNLEALLDQMAAYHARPFVPKWL